MKKTEILSALVVGVLGGAAVIAAGSSDRTLALGLFGLLATAIIGALPFRIVCPSLVTVTVLTYFSVPVAGFHLRPDMALIPGAFLSCATSGYMAQFGRWCHHPVIKLLASFVLLNFAVSAAVSPEVKKSETIALWYLLDLVVLLLVLAYYTARRDSLERRLLFAAWITIGYGIIAWALAAIHHPIPGAGIDDSGQLRTHGLSYEPNILAATAALWLVVLLGRRQRLRRQDQAFCVAAVIAISLTATRTAFVAIVLALLVAAAARNSGRVVARTVKIVAGVAAMVGVGEALLPASFSPLIHKLSHLTFGDQTASLRYGYWREAVHDLTGLHWLTGLGTNSFGMRHIDPTTIFRATPAPAYLGNLPLNTVYDVGLIGLAILAAAALRLIRERTPGDRAYRWAFLVGFLVIATGTSPFFFSYYWLFIALALLKRTSDTLDTHASPGLPKARVVAAAR